MWYWTRYCLCVRTFRMETTIGTSDWLLWDVTKRILQQSWRWRNIVFYWLWMENSKWVRWHLTSCRREWLEGHRWELWSAGSLVLVLEFGLVWVGRLQCSGWSLTPSHPISASCRQSPVWDATGGPASLLHDALGFVGTSLGLVTDTQGRGYWLVLPAP